MDDNVRREYDEIKAILRGVAERQDDSEARWEARMARAEARMAQAEARSLQMDARFDKRMRGFQTLAKIGMKEIAELRRLSRETDYKINALIASQDRTAAVLQAFTDSLRKGGNGHSAGCASAN